MCNKDITTYKFIFEEVNIFVSHVEKHGVEVVWDAFSLSWLGSEVVPDESRPAVKYHIVLAIVLVVMLA